MDAMEIVKISYCVQVGYMDSMNQTIAMKTPHKVEL